MLRLDNIKRTYVTADMKVEALKGVSLSFRKNEFVSILGPSGCGKTTLLNIIGGLDHYDDGDLYILGNSTKDFKDHDWDVYRNHRIGFVFQSYNLIPHQNIQQNVELGLAIAGMSKAERQKKAREALDKVGLAGMYKKKPNQLSGGQCQRVAIARAIVNDPDIILADEPTGALDTTTSGQVMDILKEVSKEHLIIMVTHNPDIANKYSTRIINLLDGEVVGDSMPYSAEEEMAEFREAKATKSALSKSKEEEKAKMSIGTTFGLSGRNLLTKAKRTTMTVIASSIGIIGVSAVLAVSDGVTGYIEDMEDDMLSGYPISISESMFDLNSILDSLSTSDRTSIVTSSIEDGYVDVSSMVEQLVGTSDSLTSAMVSNIITEEYEAFIDDMPSEYYKAINKIYDHQIINNIYTQDDLEGHEEGEWYSLSSLVNYATAILSQTDYSMYASYIAEYTSSITQLMDAEDYILSQYDVVAGSYPTEANELVLVLDSNYNVSDFLLTLLGYYSQDDLMDTIYHYGDPDNENYNEDNFNSIQSISFDELLGKSFYYYPNDTVYSFTGDSSSPFTYSYQPDSSWDTGTELTVVGILAPKETISYGCLSTGLYYTSALTEQFIEDSLDSTIVTYINYYINAAAAQGYDLDSVTSTVSYETNTETGEITVTTSGITYLLTYSFEGTAGAMYFPVGESSSSLMSIISSLYGSTTTSNSATLSLANVGGTTVANEIDIYPNNFDDKYLVTDYLDQWNEEGDIILSDGTVIASGRTEITYNDNLSVIISLINSVIQVITIALVAFTSLSLVVSTVMIGIITYVSVVERIKEIGVIRSLGGRKGDVSRLFIVETFIIGAFSGIFGVAVTYLIQIIVNLILSFTAGIALFDFAFSNALVIFGISVLLTVIAGLIPSASAAKKDPVVALRTE